MVAERGVAVDDRADVLVDAEDLLDHDDRRGSVVGAHLVDIERVAVGG